MQCDEARQQLDALEGVFEKRVSDNELKEHLKTCKACQDYAQERWLVAMLANMPVPDPVPGMEDRVIQRALRRPRPAPATLHARWAVAAAASVVLAVVVTLQFYPAGNGSAPAESIQAAVVEVEPQQTRMVNVLLTSPRTLADALITVRLDDNLMLEGYRDVNNLQWRTSLKSGPNKLSLPVRLMHGRSGRITVTVEHDGGRKQFAVDVNAVPGTGTQKLSMA